MTDDKLLAALAEAARRSRLGEPNMDWDDLAAGTLSEEERAALLASDEDGELAALFEPLGDDFVDGVLSDVLGIVEAGSDPVAAGSDPSTPDDVARRAAPVPDVSAPEPANRPFWMLWVAPVLALAAAVLIFLAMPAPGPGLPSYQWDVTGGDQVVRGSNTVVEGLRRLTPGSALEVAARPQERVDAVVAATAFVRQADGVLVRSAVSAEVAPSGAVRWIGHAGEDVLQPGSSEVVIVVHPADAEPSVILAAAEAGPWPRVVVPVAIGSSQ
jgi:hypothetical protein